MVVMIAAVRNSPTAITASKTGGGCGENKGSNIQVATTAVAGVTGAPAITLAVAATEATAVMFAVKATEATAVSSVEGAPPNGSEGHSCHRVKTFSAR